ncbi:MAG: hypothetical protein HYS19_02355 [Nitrosomonadales bacterium]|nr:hypothetical protein [Nitrosomonadales bacterium]
MASILNTDLGGFIDRWKERADINERLDEFDDAYQQARINSARSAGAEAFRNGLSLDEARDNYREKLEYDFAVQEFPVDDLGAVDDVGSWYLFEESETLYGSERYPFSAAPENYSWDDGGVD